MIEKVFDNKYIDLSKVVAMVAEDQYETNRTIEGKPYVDSIVFGVQLMEKMIIIMHPKAHLKDFNATEETNQEFERILSLWKSINKPVTRTNEEPNFEQVIKDFRKEYPGFSNISDAHFYTFYDFLKTAYGMP